MAREIKELLEVLCLEQEFYAEEEHDEMINKLFMEV